VILFHATDKQGAQGIQARGFAVSNVKDSAGKSWFSDTREECLTLAFGKEWLVLVDVPDETAEPYPFILPDGTPYLGNFLIPWTVVNQYRSTFRLEPVNSP
jgi:hypothetical protein